MTEAHTSHIQNQTPSLDHRATGHMAGFLAQSGLPEPDQATVKEDGTPELEWRPTGPETQHSFFSLNFLPDSTANVSSEIQPTGDEAPTSTMAGRCTLQETHNAVRTFLERFTQETPKAKETAM